MIETERLLLRQWIDSDRAAFCKLNADPETMCFFPNVFSKEESNAFIDKTIGLIQEQGYGLFAVERKSDHQFLGFIGLAHPAYETHFTPCTEIGWRIDKEHWGNGYATEGAKAVLNFAFNQLKLEEIVSFTAVLNQPSINVMKRIGMKLDLNGEFNHPRVEVGHKLERHVLYRLKREDYE